MTINYILYYILMLELDFVQLKCISIFYFSEMQANFVLHKLLFSSSFSSFFLTFANTYVHKVFYTKHIFKVI